jgi:ATP-dependent helicase/nuclease subunit A
MITALFDPALGAGGRPLTEEQREAIEDRSGSLLLSATAGSGKTSVMVERFVRLALQDGVPVSELLAITFTDKAAAELRERIRERFLELGDPGRAREAQAAHVSTIHGFCAGLLRADALRAGLDPRFEVLDERRAARLAREAFDQALEDRLAAGGADALDVVAAYGTGEVRAIVLGAHEWLRSRGHARPGLPDPRPLDDPGTARAAALRAADALAGELGALPEGGPAVAEAAARLAAFRAFAASLGDRVPEGGELRAIAPNGARGDALRTPAAEAYRDAFARFRQACVDHRALPLLDHLGELERAFAGRYAERKTERSALDFADLELGALDLLRGHAGIRERTAGRFAQVMVDEFQDVNPLQLALLELLDRDNLFEVGDELQSIYRFRHAEVGLFRARRAARAARGRARALTVNFRSEPELLHGLDLAFSGVFGDAFLPLVAGRNAAGARPGAPEPIELLVTGKAGWAEVDLGETLPSSTSWRLAEARMLAQRLAELVQDGTPERDIVVLARAATDLGLFERALEDQGLRTYLIGGRGFWSARQVQDVVAYLALLANPRDELRLYEVLASPMAGASSDELALLAAEAQAQRRPALDVLEAREDPRFAPFVARFAAHREAAPRLALDALIDRVVRETGYDLAVLRMPGGRRRLANVRKLMRLARQWEEAEGRDVRGLVDLVRELAGEDVVGEDREAQAPVEGEALDAIRLMTVHRAKGLEFPVVCVADLGREPMNGGQPLRLGPDGAVGLRTPWAQGGRESAFAWAALGERDREAEAAEERRLFYVAMTRARERLVLSGATYVEAWREGRARREPLVWIAGALDSGLAARLTDEAPEQTWMAEREGWSARLRARLSTPETVGRVLERSSLAPAVGERTQHGSEEQGAPAPGAIGRAGGEAEGARAAVGASPVDSLSYSSLEEYGRCGYRFHLQRGLGLPDVAAGPGAVGERRAGVSAAQRGVVAHALLERLDLASAEPPTPAEIHRVAALDGLVASEYEVEDLQGLVRAFAASALRARLASADTVAREERFAFLLGPAGLLITGVMDVLAREAEGALVVDYKSDRLAGRAPAALVAREYGVQRLVYALAALRAGHRRVEVVHCFLERPEALVVASFGADQAPALEAELEGLAAGVLAGRFAPAAEPNRELCLTCPGRAALCSWGEEMTLRSRAARPDGPGGAHEAP